MVSAREEKQALEALAQRQTTTTRAVEETMALAAEPDSTQLDNDVPPPAYGAHLGEIHGEKNGFGTRATVSNDGRVNIRIDQRARRMSQLLAPALNQINAVQEEQPPPPPYIPPSLGGEPGVPPPPPMNVVIQIVGSRGDVQPFVALAKVLKDRYGHRVRLATHPNFEDFVTENGIEFFNIGGDPANLMAFMVKNPGLIPGLESLKAGDVGKRRKEIAEYMDGCWRSCYETGNGMGSPPTGDSFDESSSQLSGQITTSDEDPLQRPFVADCIIANPPSFAHAHLAERLGIPLHIFFTMPYSPTQAFPHPLANIQASNAEENLTNYISYQLVDMLTWQGLGDIINRFRKKTLGLDEMSLFWAPGMLQRLQIPHTYTWSPALIPKPRDWGVNVSISGFFFLNLAANYTPPADLQAFLDAGPPPVYIGFGSIVLDDPNAMTNLIFDAVHKSGQRALVSKGWGGIGVENKPDSIFMLGNVPHDWLFQHVSCVVHHGGAGTTAAGITAGRPTLVVPFFGDQPFWGAMVARAGAGPEPIPNKRLTADNLAAGILKCVEPQMQERAQEMANSIAKEKGTEVGAQSFHQFLKVDELRCSLAPSRAAVWSLRRPKGTRLSAMAAHTLIQEGQLDFSDLRPFRAREYACDSGPVDPLSGGATAVMGICSDMLMGVADLPGQAVKLSKKSHQAEASSDTGSIQSANTQSSQSQSKWKTLSASDKGMNKFIGAGLAAPMDFSVAMSRGFHNAPKLYRDETVRESDHKVTGWRSGFKAAGKEFAFGMYDGVSGLFVHPYKGAVKEGGVGFLKGFGKGIGGFALKPSAALFALPGYTMKGAYKEIRKAMGDSSAQSLILAARTAQGYDEHQRASMEERRDVVKRWMILHKDLKKKGKTPEKKENGREQQRPPIREAGRDVPPSTDPESAMLAVGGNVQAQTQSRPQSQLHAIDTHTYVSHSQIRAQQPYQGNPRSIEQLQRQSASSQIVNTPATTSISSPNAALDNDSIGPPSPDLSDATLPSPQAGSSSLAYSKHLAGTTTAEYEQGPEEKTAAELGKEQVVLEYIKEQSLREEELRRKMDGAGASFAEEEDEELKRVLELSIKER